MKRLRRAADRGSSQLGWLDSRHTFSFADYHDPDFVGFSVLRVLNQDRVGTMPRYDQKHFDPESLRGALRLVVSPDGRDGSLQIGQDVALFAGRFSAGDSFRHEIGAERTAWMHVASGRVSIDGLELRAGDGLAIADESDVTIASADVAEVLLWGLPG